MDDYGNILIKRLATKSNIYVKTHTTNPDETSINNDVLKLPISGGATHLPQQEGANEACEDGDQAWSEFGRHKVCYTADSENSR